MGCHQSKNNIEVQPLIVDYDHKIIQLIEDSKNRNESSLLRTTYKLIGVSIFNSTSRYIKITDGSVAYRNGCL
jgi:hypothetical protein